MSELAWRGDDKYATLYCNQGTGNSWVGYTLPGYDYMEKKISAAWKEDTFDFRRRINRVLTRFRIWMRFGIRQGIRRRARVQQVIDPGYVGIRRLRRITPIRK